MAARGDVLALKRRVGFGAGHATERFVVVQADALNEALETALVAPLDAAFSFYRRYPGAVRISAAEASTSRDQAAVLTAIVSIDLSRFEDGAVGRAAQATLAQIDRTLALILDLRP